MAANLTLFFPAASPLRIIGSLLLITIFPGWLWVNDLASASLRLTLAAALSYTFTNLITLLLHYIPGPLPMWQLVAALNLVALLPLLWQRDYRNLFPKPHRFLKPLRFKWAYLLILLPALFLRFTNLNYSEFQGDEALIMISAAEAMSGHENALFLRSKGPAEVLMPLALWRLTGTITEGIARLPFALATLYAIITVYLIGQKLTQPHRSPQIIADSPEMLPQKPHRSPQLFADSSEITPLFAAAFLAFNGFMVAFGRIVQYQGMVVWFSSLAFLMLCQWRETRQPRWAFLSGFFLGSGLLAHYDAILVLPALLWLGREGTKKDEPREQNPLTSHFSFLLGLLLVTLPFYLPYSLDPQANRTSDYLGERIGHSLRNNLPAFFQFNSFYSSFYYMVITSILVFGFILWLIWRARWGRWWLTLPLITGVIAVTIYPEALKFGSQNFAGGLFGLLFLVTWLALPMTSIEQALLIWLAVPFLGYNFVVALGLTHIYTIVPAWSLMAALATGQISEREREREREGREESNYEGREENKIETNFAPFALVFAFFAFAFTLFLWNAFVRHDVEYWQDYPQGNLTPFWTPHTELPKAGFFGLAHRAGWKAVGQAISQGDLVGDYGSNEEPDVTTWYTRGAPRACDPYPEFYFMADDLIDPVKLPNDILESAYREVGQFNLTNGKAMKLHQRNPTTLQLGQLDETPLAAQFDQTAWPEAFARSGRGATPAAVNFKQLIKLIGYDLDTRRAHPQGRVSVTLYWQALTNIPMSYQVFVHLERDAGLAAQADGVPVCWTYPTDVWRPGQIIADQHAIALPAEIAQGAYRLEIGWYRPDDFTRLDWLDEAGNPAGTSFTLNNVIIR